MKSIKTSKDVVIEFESSPERVKQIIYSSGSKIGNIWFYKKSNGELRKMSYRLGVKNPKHIKKPSGNSNRRSDDASKDLLTVYSTNDVVRDKDNNIIGRGAYKRIPLNNVVRIVAGGRVYEIQRKGLI